MIEIIIALEIGYIIYLMAQQEASMFHYKEIKEAIVEHKIGSAIVGSATTYLIWFAGSVLMRAF